MARVPIRLLTVTYVPSILLLVALVIASTYTAIPLGWLTRDPAQIVDVHPFTGVLSNLGVLLWCSSAAICLFTGLVLHHTPRTKDRWFFIYSALLTLALLFDDFFLFHDFLAQQYLGFGEEVVYAFLVGVTAAYLLIFRRIILQTEYAILCMALAFFSISVASDAIFEAWLRQRLGEWKYLVEDGAKFLGIASWCSYHAWVAYRFLIARPGVSPSQGLKPTH